MPSATDDSDGERRHPTPPTFFPFSFPFLSFFSLSSASITPPQSLELPATEARTRSIASLRATRSARRLRRSSSSLEAASRSRHASARIDTRDNSALASRASGVVLSSSLLAFLPFLTLFQFRWERFPKAATESRYSGQHPLSRASFGRRTRLAIVRASSAAERTARRAEQTQEVSLHLHPGVSHAALVSDSKVIDEFLSWISRDDPEPELEQVSA